MTRRFVLMVTIVTLALALALACAGATPARPRRGVVARSAPTTCGRRRAISAPAPSPVVASRAPSRRPCRWYEWSRAPTGGRCAVFAGPIPAALAGRVTPLPGIFMFPYAPLHVALLQGAPPGAVRVDGDAPLPPGTTVAGDFVVDQATARDGGPDVFVVPRCTRPGEPLPAVPPSAAAIWEQTPLPRAVVHASPPGTPAWPGIVNLETRFWGAAFPDAQADVVLDGYSIDVAAHPVAYAWSFGDGTMSVAPARGAPTPRAA